MTAPLDLIRSRLDAASLEPRGSGSRFMALCPAHEDRCHSLSVREGDDGRALVNCFAGCQATDVVARLGLAMRDLFDPSTSPARPTPAPRRRKRDRRPNRLPDNALPIDRVLARYAPNYRATAALNVWVATCKVCGGDLLIHAELDEETCTVPSGPVTLACPNGCVTNVRRRAAA